MVAKMESYARAGFNAGNLLLAAPGCVPVGDLFRGTRMVDVLVPKTSAPHGTASTKMTRSSRHGYVPIVRSISADDFLSKFLITDEHFH
jgi:hypothetical protein